MFAIIWRRFPYAAKPTPSAPPAGFLVSGPICSGRGGALFGPAVVPLTGLYVAAALAPEVGPYAAQPYRLHRPRKRHLAAVQAGRWIGKIFHLARALSGMGFAIRALSL
jgi:hypothetical protein